MFIFSIKQYIKNAWYNLVFVLILALTVVANVIFVTNITRQLRIHNLVKPYLNEDSLIIRSTWETDSLYESLSKVDGVLKTVTASCNCPQMSDVYSCEIYSEEIMDKFEPRLSRGKQIEDVKLSKDEIGVLVSENKQGLNPGDKISLDFYSNGEPVTYDAVITGIVKDGQRVFVSNNELSSDMGYEDIYLMHSFEQTEEPLIITTEKELSKVDVQIDKMYEGCIIKFAEDITHDEWIDNYEKICANEIIKSYSYPSSKKLVEGMENSLDATMMKYMPLEIAMLVLVITCIGGISLVKSFNDVKYFSVLHISGMPYKKAVLITFAEMTINSVLAMILANSFIVIQNKLNLFGTINCELGIAQILISVAICIVVIVSASLVTRSVLHEKTPAQILKDTAY